MVAVVVDTARPIGLAGTQIDATLTYTGDNELTNDFGDSTASVTHYDATGGGITESGNSAIFGGFGGFGGFGQQASLVSTLTDAGIYYLVVHGSADEPRCRPSIRSCGHDI